MRQLHVAVACGLLVTLCRSASGGSLDHSKIALHVHSNTLKGVCLPMTQGGEAPVGPCSDLGTAAIADTPTILYVIAAQADSGQGFSAISAGIRYSPTLFDLFPDVHWYGCATTTSFDGPDGSWPSEGSGARMELNACQIAPPPWFGSVVAFGNPAIPVGWTVAVPVGAVCFGLFLVTFLLQQEAARFDQEERARLELAERYVVRTAKAAGIAVISTDTNLNPAHSLY